MIMKHIRQSFRPFLSFTYSSSSRSSSEPPFVVVVLI